MRLLITPPNSDTTQYSSALPKIATAIEHAFNDPANKLAEVLKQPASGVLTLQVVGGVLYTVDGSHDGGVSIEARIPCCGIAGE